MRTKTLVWQILTTCNLRCKSCSVWKLKPMHFDIDRLPSWVEELKANGVRFVAISGGEPTLHPQFLSICKGLKEAGFYTHVTSNGSFPTRVLHATPYLDAVTISLDSDTAEGHNHHRGRDSFEKAVQTIRAVRGKVKILTANAVPTQENKNKIASMVRFCNEELGVPLSFCYPMNNQYIFRESGYAIDPEDLRRIYRQLIELGRHSVLGNTPKHYREAELYTDGNFRMLSKCQAGQKVFFADLNCHVYPCFTLMDHPINDDDGPWKLEDLTACNQCMTQCFREPSMKNRIEQARLLYHTYRITHRAPPARPPAPTELASPKQDPSQPGKGGEG